MFIDLTCPHCDKPVRIIQETRVPVSYEEGLRVGILLYPDSAKLAKPLRWGGVTVDSDILSQALAEGSYEDTGD